MYTLGMGEPTYPAARVVAERIHSRIVQQPGYTSTPGDALIEEVISAAFWASLRREEGRTLTVSITLIPPEQVYRPLLFSNLLSLDPDVLVRLAPAVERPGIHL